MLTVYKYRIQPDTPIEAPKGAEALAVSVQNGDSYLWALVDPNIPNTNYRVWTVPTGGDFPKDAIISNYLGTLFFSDAFLNGLVFHVFSDMPKYSTVEL